MHSWQNWQNWHSWHSSFQNCHGLGTEPAGWRLGHRTDPFRSWNTQSIRRRSETFGDVVHSHRCWKAKSGRRIFRIFLTHGQFTGLKICRPSWARTSPSAEGNCSSPTAAIWIRAVPECQTAHNFGINEQSHSWFSFESFHFVEAQTLTEESTLTAGYHRPLLLLHQIQLPAGQRRQYLQ